MELPTGRGAVIPARPGAPPLRRRCATACRRRCSRSTFARATCRSRWPGRSWSPTSPASCSGVTPARSTRSRPARPSSCVLPPGSAGMRVTLAGRHGRPSSRRRRRCSASVTFVGTRQLGAYRAEPIPAASRRLTRRRRLPAPTPSPTPSPSGSGRADRRSGRSASRSTCSTSRSRTSRPATGRG